MLKLILVVFACVWLLTSCSSGESKSNEDTVTGIYVREYSREILNQLSGNKVGMRTIRDTLYIREADTGYRIANSKWRINDYDEDGWQNMEHGEEGSWPSFEATYDAHNKRLTGSAAGSPSLVVDGNTISVGGKSDIVFTKVD
jgi:hypothetical protein